MTLTLVWVCCRVALEWRAFRVSSSEKSVFRETDFLYIFDKRSVASFPGASNDLCLVMGQVEIHVKRETGETAKELVILVERRAGCERCGDKEAEHYAGSYSQGFGHRRYIHRETPFLTLECGPF